MHVLPEGQSPQQPDWIQPIRRQTKLSKKGFEYMQSVRVGQFGRYEGDVIKKEEVIFQATKENKKSSILDDFRAGVRIRRAFRDIAWDIFKEEGIDALSEWKPAEEKQK